MVNDEWQSGPFSLVLPLSLEVGLPSPPSHAALHNRSLSPYTVVLPPPPTADRRHRASAWQSHTHTPASDERAFTESHMYYSSLCMIKNAPFGV